MHHFGNITHLLCHTFQGTIDMDCFTFKINDKARVNCAVTLYLCEKITIYIDIPMQGFTEKAMAPHYSTLAWKIPWTEEPGRLQSVWSQRVRHN